MQVVGIIVIFILAILIVLTFVIFGIFKNANSAPKLFGYRVYVVNNNRMEPRIPEGSAVFVEEGIMPQPGSQSVILCNIEGNLYVIGYVGTETTETGAVSYIVKYDNATDDRTWGITQADIIGVAKTYDEFFGWVIRFASSKAGMMLIVIIPCLLIIIYEVGMLLLSRKKSDDYSWANQGAEEASEKVSKRSRKADEPVIRRVGGEHVYESVLIAEDIHIPIDTEKEEKFVEKQLRRANDSFSSTAFDSLSMPSKTEEINLDPLDVKPESLHKPDIEPKAKPAEVKPAEEKTLSTPMGDLSASRIDELIKLLEDEKKRLEGK